MSNNTQAKQRIDYNRALMHILIEAIEAYPDMRFIQLLSSLDFLQSNQHVTTGLRFYNDEYNLESKDLLERVKIAKQRLGL